MPKYLPNAEPFFFDGNQVGCLLIHGFTGTPYEMRGLGEYLAREYGYTVSGPALAGHATCVEDCARTTWQDWYASVEEAYRVLTARCEQVFAIGLSLGGALVLHLAAQVGAIHESPLHGVISLAAPAYYKHPLEFWFRNLPFLFHLVPYVKKSDKSGDTQDLTILANHPSYDRNPTRAARSLIVDLLPHLRSELHRVQCPALLIQSRHDRTVPTDSMPTLYSALGSSDKQMVWLERGGHLILEDYGKDHAFQLISEFIARHLNAATPRTQAVPAVPITPTSFP